jgi:hypothetical protein
MTSAVEYQIVLSIGSGLIEGSYSFRGTTLYVSMFVLQQLVKVCCSFDVLSICFTTAQCFVMGASTKTHNANKISQVRSCVHEIPQTSNHTPRLW